MINSLPRERQCQGNERIRHTLGGRHIRKRNNYGDSKKIHGFQELGGRDNKGNTEDF